MPPRCRRDDMSPICGRDAAEMRPRLVDLLYIRTFGISSFGRDLTGMRSRWFRDIAAGSGTSVHACKQPHRSRRDHVAGSLDRRSVSGSPARRSAHPHRPRAAGKEVRGRREADRRVDWPGAAESRTRCRRAARTSPVAQLRRPPAPPPPPPLTARCPTTARRRSPPPQP